MIGYIASSSGPLNTTVSLVDTTDVVQGGTGGTANVATKQLANNDAYLYKIMGGFENIVTKSNAGPITSVNLSVADLKRNMVILYQPANGYFTGVLPAVTSVRANDVVCIRRQPTGHIKPVKIATSVGNIIYDKYNNNVATSLYLHDGECVWLMSTGSEWVIINFEGNLYRVGEQYLGYRQQPGTLQRDGTVYNRADYPRLWAMVSAIGGPLLVTDSDWNTDTSGVGLYENKSRFSDGDGSTTFRVPDDRGIFDRAMTYGAGRDADRVGAGTGSLVGDIQADDFKAHTHGINIPNSTGGSLLSMGTHSTGSTTSSTGGTETRPVNVAKVPLLIY